MAFKNLAGAPVFVPMGVEKNSVNHQSRSRTGDSTGSHSKVQKRTIYMIDSRSSFMLCTWEVVVSEAAMDMKAGVPFEKSSALGARRCTGTRHENVVWHGCPIYLAAEFPINQVSNPDRLVWYSVQYDITNAQVSVKCPGFRVCIHHGWSVDVLRGGFV